MRKRIFGIAIFFLIIGLFAGCQNKEDELDVDYGDMSTIEIAVSYVQDLVNERYSSLNENYKYNQAMQKLIDNKQLDDTFKQINTQFGKCLVIGEAFVTEKDPHEIVNIPIKFQNGNTNINVVFDNKKNISGVNLGTYTEKAISEYKMPDNVEEIDLSFDTSKGDELPGTLTIPKDSKDKVPCVVLVHGSGPNDRDETLYENKPFRDIAHGLASQGIAVYRYDKRTNVFSEKVSKDKKFTLDDETVNDAVDAVKMLEENDYIDKEKIVVLGHSLGGYAIPRIATKSNIPAGYIIMAGNARALEDMMTEQVNYITNLDKDITKEEQDAIDMVNSEVNKIKNLDEVLDNEVILGAYKAYYKDLKNYDPVKLSKKITKPVMVMQGDRDYQVNMKDFELWKQGHENDENWSFRLYGGLNHLMMFGEGEPTPEEYMKVNNVDIRVIDDIDGFVKAL